MQHPKELLLAIEPDYARVAALGPDAIPALVEMVELGDRRLSSRATYALGYLAAAASEPGSRFPGSALAQIVKALEGAACSRLDVVRVAAAAATSRLPSAAAERIQLILLQDADVGVRKTVFEAAKADVTPAVVSSIGKWADDEPIKEVRDLAAAAINRARS